jgi:hypothetical protein
MVGCGDEVEQKIKVMKYHLKLGGIS